MGLFKSKSINIKEENFDSDQSWDFEDIKKEQRKKDDVQINAIRKTRLKETRENSIPMTRYIKKSKVKDLSASNQEITTDNASNIYAFCQNCEELRNDLTYLHDLLTTVLKLLCVENIYTLKMVTVPITDILHMVKSVSLKSYENTERIKKLKSIVKELQDRTTMFKELQESNPLHLNFTMLIHQQKRKMKTEESDDDSELDD